MKLLQGKRRLSIGKRLFLRRVLGPWKRLPREEPVRSRGGSGQCSQSYGLVLAIPVRSTEMDSMILMGPLQLEI